MRNGRIKFVESNIPNNLRVSVRYTTRYRDPQRSQCLPKWYTSCKLVDKETGVIWGRAHSNCNEEDQPVKKIGRAIAVGRAFKQAYYLQQAGVESSEV